MMLISYCVVISKTMKHNILVIWLRGCKLLVVSVFPLCFVKLLYLYSSMSNHSYEYLFSYMDYFLFEHQKYFICFPDISI